MKTNFKPGMVVLFSFLLVLSSCNRNKTVNNSEDHKDTLQNRGKNLKEEAVNDFLDKEYNFVTYHNARFDYCMKYPSELVFPQGESENGDGQVFLSKDQKFSLTVSGMFNTEGLDIGGVYRKELDFYSNNSSYHLTFYQHEANHFIFSGLKGKMFFYVKTFLVKNKLFSIYVEYPGENGQLYSALTKEILKTFPECR